MKKKINFADLIPLIVFLGLWEFCSFAISEKYFPHVLTIIGSINHSFLQDPYIKYQGGGDHGFSLHILNTIEYYFIGLAIGLCLGILVALVLFLKPMLRELFEPIQKIFFIIPPLIISPFILLLINNGGLSKILIVSLYTLLSISIYTLNSLDNISKNLLDLTKLYDLGLYDKIRKVFLPGALPGILGGIRVNISISMGLLIVAEYIGPLQGIGKVLHYVISFNNATLILVAIFWAATIVLFTDFLLILTARRLLRWT
ncbi:MAG TPA: ABC transporter permease subunit [Chitinophagales bacterium]|nr:ABC transporter permease subunit [Chitinophagales bacterium]